ncbi:uncharacterized protein UHO2_07349 [Ustilago hordei]|uniref:RecQ-mediated genome instability protein 1 n=1 Tax=Ustilago hordei TaxID=120017 RepID=I2FS06_USTHO|nr:uncharacterized protein UHO2_07349 [Ustilago hordei]CCF49699.1 uncharacterized protein UHOR_03225 [Ustilago hordei]SYW87212.1 uncharacterized protein UHO2_07349 [Ustilago hordei]
MSKTEQVPAAVRRLLSARYPTLEVDPSWLKACVKRLRQRDPALQTASPDQLARSVRQELLDTDLAKVVPPSYSRLSPDALLSASGKVGDAGRGAVLAQIESMIDIGYSASSQLEIAEARREARRANIDPNDVPAEVKAAQSSSAMDHMADFQAQEDDKIQATTIFARRMLKLELSDGGKDDNVFAIELERIPGLDMNAAKMGTKLLLKGALIKDSYLLLTSKTVAVEGGWVREKDQVAEDTFINKLRSQLGKPPLGDNATGHPDGPSNNAIPEPSSNGAASAEQRGFSPDDDESELLAALEAEEEMKINAPIRPARTTENAAAKGSTANHKGSASLAASQASTSKRMDLVIPEPLSQGSAGKLHSQRSSGAEKLKATQEATQEDPILLLESDDNDELFAAIPDIVLDDAGSRRSEKESNSRNDPIVIESSPEP